jgi:hypothetical protein
MTTVAGRIVIALVLFAAGLACVTEARHARRVADAYARLATLRYDSVTGTAAYANTTVGWRLPWAITTLAAEDRRHVVAASYWQEDFDALTNLTTLAETDGTEGASDPALLFVAANATFRAARAQTEPTADAIERLNRVVQAYGEVLRSDSTHADAAFNFEYVSRFRDMVSRRDTGRRSSASEAATTVLQSIPSPDLPVGPTIHGLPGRPPDDIPGSDFRTIAPMPDDEREESDPGQGPAPRRRG